MTAMTDTSVRARQSSPSRRSRQSRDLWIIVGREVRSYARQRRTLVAMIVLAAILANAGRAVVAISPLVQLAVHTRHAAIAGINLSGRQGLAQSALVWIGLLPVLFSAQQAAITIAAERERRSLTALLATPISMGSIFTGKLLGSLMPGVMMLSVAYTVYLASIATAGPQAATWLPLPIVFAVLSLLLGLSALMNTIALLISAFAPTVAAASISATFVLLPLSFAVAVLSVKVTDLGPGPLAVLALAALGATGILLAGAARLIGRGQLLAV